MAHYGVLIIPSEHKNSINAVLALLAGEDPEQSENLAQPLNATGGINNPVTHYVGGRPYETYDLPIIQDLLNDLLEEEFPVQGVSGEVSYEDAQAACAALITMVGSAEIYTSNLAAATLSSALSAHGLARVTEE